MGIKNYSIILFIFLAVIVFNSSEANAEDIQPKDIRLFPGVDVGQINPEWTINQVDLPIIPLKKYKKIEEYDENIDANRWGYISDGIVILAGVASLIVGADPNKYGIKEGRTLSFAGGIGIGIGLFDGINRLFQGIELHKEKEKAVTENQLIEGENKRIVVYNEKIIKENSGFIKKQENLANIYKTAYEDFKAFDYEKALAGFEKSINEDSFFTRGYCMIGYSYFLKNHKDSDEKISDYTNAVENFKNYIDKLGRPNDAIEKSRLIEEGIPYNLIPGITEDKFFLIRRGKVIEEAKKNAGKISSLLIDIYEASGMYDKAVKTCKEWLQDNPEDIVIKEKLDKMEKKL